MDRVLVMQLVQSFQSGGLSRRDFLRRSSLALGGVASANLVLAACAESPNPDAPAVVEEDDTAQGGPPSESGRVEYGEHNGQTLTGYLARSESGGGPGVILIQEWWGLNAHIEDVADRLAAEGFVVLAPDLYHGTVVSEPDEARKLVMELDRVAGGR